MLSFLNSKIQFLTVILYIKYCISMQISSSVYYLRKKKNKQSSNTARLPREGFWDPWRRFMSGSVQLLAIILREILKTCRIYTHTDSTSHGCRFLANVFWPPCYRERFSTAVRCVTQLGHYYLIVYWLLKSSVRIQNKAHSKIVLTH